MLLPKAIRWLPVALLAPLAACGMPDSKYFGEVPEDPDPTHLRWCNSGEPEYLDPGLVNSTTGITLVYQMFDGLTDHNMDGLPEPSLATHWDILDDQRRFVFHLRKDAVWSNGRQLDAHDFAYHLARILHPDTGSLLGEPLYKIKNGELYSKNRIKKVLRDAGGFQAGDLVEVVGLNGEVLEKPGEAGLANSNVRTAEGPLRLRDQGAAAEQAYATVPAGAEVTLIEFHHADPSWAYVFWPDGNDGSGVYGWVPAAELTGQPHGDVAFTVRAVARNHIPGQMVPVGELKDVEAEDRQIGTIKGRDLLMLPEVLGIRVIDPFTLEIETAGPVPFMIDMTPQRQFRPSPREAVSREPKRWVKPEHIITSGPFHLSEHRQRDYIRMKKSPTWWNADAVKLETITAYSINDQAASANLYFTGECDAITSNNVPASYLPVLNGERTGKSYADYTAAPYLGVYIYLFNTKELDNVHLRRALSFAVDRRPIPDILHGGQIPTAQYVPGTPIDQLTPEQRELCGVSADHKGVAALVSSELCYVPPPGLDFDLAQAKEELAIAKKEMGASFDNEITIKFNSGVEGHKLIAEYIQDQWIRNLGLDVTLEVQEWKTYLKDVRNEAYEVGRMGWIGNYPDPESEFLSVLKCDNANNYPKWCNAEFQRLFAKAEASSDRKARLALMRQAEKLILEEAPIMPLYVYTQHHLQKPYVRDLAINLPDQPPLWRAWIDPDWKSKQKDD